MNNFTTNKSHFTVLQGLVMLLFILLIVSGCKKKDFDKDDDKECTIESQDGYRTVVFGSATREYILHVPTSYDNNTATPLIISLHGFGGCAANFSRDVGEGYGLNSIANSENFLVAYPQAVLREKGDKYWEPGDSGSQDINENDAFFIEQLISNINDEYNVDESRVYATGYSNGGMMAYSLACSRSDIIAAVGIMSGTMLAETCDETEYTSVILFHGSGDDVLPYNGNQDYQSVASVVDFWLDHNGISESSEVVTQLNSGDVTQTEYTGGNGNTSVVLYTVDKEFGKSGGHVWFSDDIDGVSPNQILWDFLSAYSLDD